jgi:(2R)-3-sulfolactate dehydrogenase (NADP+)
MALLSLKEADALVQAALLKSGASSVMAASVARALVLAESQGQAGHGLSRVPQYATHLKNGRANGQAVAVVAQRKGAALVIDAKQGLAFPACDLAVAEGIKTAKELGVAFVGVKNSHHAGVMVDHLRAASQAGMVALAFANSPSAMPAAGGKHAIFGTNPIAAIFPRRNNDPLMIDLSLSEVARGKVMVAAKEGKAIPLGWALDEAGNPTTDAQAALKGSMLPVGAASSTKGAMLALIIELLVTAVIGAQFGFEASSFFVDEGNQPKIGQAFLLIDPSALIGHNDGNDSYLDRIEVLVKEMLVDEGVRLAGARRLALERKAQEAGVSIPDALLQSLQKLAI